MEEQGLEEKLNELVKELTGAAQPGKPATPAGKAKGNQKQIDKNVTGLADSLDYLRICIKYQLLDIEATRRENDYLRKLLRDKDNS